MSMSCLHQNLKVRVHIIILQIILGPVEACTREPSCHRLREDLSTLNGHAQAIKHDVSVAVLRAKGLLSDFQTRRTVYGAIYSCYLGDEGVVSFECQLLTQRGVTWEEQSSRQHWPVGMSMK